MSSLLLCIIITALPVGNLARVMTPCVTFETPCNICASFTEQQLNKIAQRKRYVKKQKRDTTSSKNDERDLLGDDVDSFLDRMQTMRVLQITSLLHPGVLSPYPSVHCLSKHQQKLSHPPRVLPYSRRLNQI